jgi:hypothetical protein
MHTDIHASSRIQTHNPSVQASEEGSCLRLRGRCDQHFINAVEAKFCNLNIHTAGAYSNILHSIKVTILTQLTLNAKWVLESYFSNCVGNEIDI